MKPLIVVHHVPKTAGSSLRVALKENLGDDRVYWHVVDGNIFDDLPSLLKRQDELAVIGGHFGYKVAEQFGFDRPLLRASMVREPLALLLSAINYVTERPGHPQNTKVAPDTPEFLRTNLFKRYSSVQCVIIASETKASKAIARIGRSPYLVGTSENVEEVFTKIMQIIGEPIVTPIRRLNVGSKNYDWFDQEEARRLFEDGVAEDRKLYNYIAEGCGGLLDTWGAAIRWASGSHNRG